MPDVADTVPPAIDQTGNNVFWRISGAIADLTAPKAATEVCAATSYRITHSFTPSGFALDGDQTVDVDDRLALPDGLESLGKVTRTLGFIEYVDSDEPGSAAVVLAPAPGAKSKSGHFMERRKVPISTLAAATQKVATIPVTLGPQIRVPVDGTGKFRIKQRVSITGPIIDGVLAA